MRNLSPRQYFETRLRKLPILKCAVNKEWKDEKIAQVMVLRQHVNGNVSGANFLVDLLCLGVKDATWFFNTDSDEMTEMMAESGLNWIDIPYTLAHNIVYAGLEFAEEFHIKPHPDFAIAKYALEEDDDAIELIEIETGENDMPHLIERYPGQYADAHSKLKKYAGEGNYQVSLAIISEDGEDDADDLGYEDVWDDDDGDDSLGYNEEDNWDDDWDDDDAITLNEIPLGELTLYDAMMLPSEDILDVNRSKERNEREQLTIHAERIVRQYESLEQHPDSYTGMPEVNQSVATQIEQIRQIADEAVMGWEPFPNGCDEHDYEQGMEDFFDLKKKFPELTVEEKSKHLDELLQSTGIINPWVLAFCVIDLFTDEDGPVLFQTLSPYIFSNRQYPLVALAQSILVTAEPELYPQLPLLKSNSPVLKDVCTDYISFNAEEYCLFYALRWLQAIQQNNIPLMATWYRLMVETDEAELFASMVAHLQFKMMNASEGFLSKIIPKS
jgi:hypothetical protein